MKKLNRLLSLILAILMVSALFTVSLPVSAATGEGLTFSSEVLYAPDGAFDEVANTFEAWIKIPKSERTKRSFILSSSWTGNRYITFEIKSGVPRVAVTEAEDKEASWEFKEVGNVCTGGWIHVAIVRDPVASTLNCYINGELKQSLPITDVWKNDIAFGEPLCIGGQWGTDSSVYFKGAIREIAIFKTSRTADEIKADMNAPKGESLVLHYDMSNAKVGENIKDTSGNGYDAICRENQLWIKSEDKKPVTDYAYSFAVIGDMQALNYYYPDSVKTMFEWIASNVESKKIKHVIGLGDITEKSNTDEWSRAKAGFQLFDGKVDYSFVRGNHDTAAKYNVTFPWATYKDKVGGAFANNMLNYYKTFSVGEVKYLMLNLDFGPNDEVLKWAGEICEQYPDHNVIINTHAYLYLDGSPITAEDHVPPVGNGGSNNGDDMWEKFVSKHENIVLILCGHMTGNRLVVSKDEGVNGNTVTTLLVNTSNVEKNNNGALGMVAMLYFSEDGKSVDVEYYSTTTDRYYRSINQLSFDLDLVGEEPKETVASSEAEGSTADTQAAASGCSSTLSLGIVAIIPAMLGTALVVARKKED
ncbi:MAG: metallophosphoesterase [Clostridia bacterium]|nr:metallophosphoesterase [Clostridia bacterium]